jgi:hypothetical protein
VDRAKQEELARELQAARKAYEDAKVTAAQLLERARDLGAMHPDGRAAAKKAIEIRRAATQRYGNALEEMSRFLLASPSPAGSGVIEHHPSTGHFRCVCGERLSFTPSSVCTPLEDVCRKDGRKIGRCPRCQTLHVVTC